jgi:predicted ATPase
LHEQVGFESLSTRLLATDSDHVDRLITAIHVKSCPQIREHQPARSIACIEHGLSAPFDVSLVEGDLVGSEVVGELPPTTRQPGDDARSVARLAYSSPWSAVGGRPKRDPTAVLMIDVCWQALDVWKPDEPAREILAEHRASAEQDALEISTERFVDLILQRSITMYEKAVERSEPVVFDRGIPDCIAYALHLGTDPRPAIEASRTYRYNEDVLIFEPWEVIYTTDDERTMALDQVMAFHCRAEEAYRIAGYTLITVPTGTLEERVVFVEEFVGHAQVFLSPWIHNAMPTADQSSWTSSGTPLR